MTAELWTFLCLCVVESRKTNENEKELNILDDREKATFLECFFDYDHQSNSMVSKMVVNVIL